VNISGVGVAGYNGGVKITGTPTPTTFTYTAASGLGSSGGGTVSSSSCGTCDSTGVFDNLMGANGRFIIGELDAETTAQNVSQYIFAVSTSNNPTTFTTADWNFYHITTTEGSGGPSTQSWSDYPGNPGFNADAFVETFNMFGGGPNGTQVVSVKASDLAAGNPLITSGAGQNVFRNDVPGGIQNYRPTVMQDAAPGNPMWLIHNDGDGANIHVVKMTNVLSNSPSFDGSGSNPGTNLALPAPDQFLASGIGNPLNPDNTAAIDGDDDSGDFDPQNPGGGGAFDPGSRILNAGEFNNTIVAAHTVAVAAGLNTLASAQPNDKNGNPLGGSGYTVGDTLTLVGGTFTTAAQLTVQTIASNGRITSVSVANPGSYSSLSGVSGAPSGGTGTGASFSLFFTGELVAQWYAIDVSSGTPAFQMVGGNPNVGRIGFGANTYSFEPSININPSGEIGLGFMESDTVGGAANATTGGFISTFVAARLPTDAAGTMDPVVLVPKGTGTAKINGRVGDFSGLSVDPQNGTFWQVNEFGGAGGPTDIANFTPEAPPMVTPPSDQTAVEGTPKSINLGSFTDPDGSPWTVKVDWGDSSTDSFSVASAGSLGSLTHTYAEEGNYTPKVTVTDSTLLSGSATFNIAVSDPAVTPTGGFLVTGVEGADAGSQTVATFTDPGGAEVASDYSASINWGDGTPATIGTITGPGVGGVFTVTADHTYGEEGSFPISVTLSHETASTALASSTATVSDPKVVATGTSITAIACLPLTGVTVATFTDPGGAEPNPSDPSGTINNHYQVASINWGDATPLDTTTGTLSYGGAPDSMTDPFSISASHTYANSGVYTVTTIIDHEGSTPVTVTSTITVRDNIGLLVLDPSGSGALTVSGNAGITVNNCGAVVVDSSNATAAIVSGHTAAVTAMDIDVTGGAVTNGGGRFSTPVGHETPTADPIALPLPAPIGPLFGAVNYSGSITLTLSPGTYIGGIHDSGQGNIVLSPGIYYLQGGGLQVSGQGSLTGAGVLIVNAPIGPNDTITFTGQGNVVLSAPLPASLTGVYAAYKGITIFQDPASTLPVTVTGKGGVTMDGALYAPMAPLNISGNGGLTDSTDTTAPVAEVIVFDVNVVGNGNLTINADAPASNPPSNTPLPGAAKASFTSFTSSANPAVPGQPLTLTVVMASSPAIAGPPQGSIDFFDTTTHLDLGSITLSGGVATLTTSTLTLGGHIITATYFAGSPNFAPPAPNFDSLTQQLQSETIVSGTLFAGGNNVQVQLKNGQVVVNPHDGSAKFQTPLAGLTDLVVYGQGNGANIQVDNQLTLPTFLFAGNGTSTELQGGGGPTVEVGGSGGGRLNGGTGRNILIAGSGGGQLQGGTGGSILIGGFTNFDSNLAVLQAALTEWSSTSPLDTYAVRTAFLASTFNAATVHSDGLADQLQGGGGSVAIDWFFASALDQITGANVSDTQVTIS
jgi:hypothetical protein